MSSSLDVIKMYIVYPSFLVRVAGNGVGSRFAVSPERAISTFGWCTHTHTHTSKWSHWRASRCATLGQRGRVKISSTILAASPCFR